MRNKIMILSVLVLLMPFFALSQNVKIVGTTNRPNTLVRLMSCTDKLTYFETQLAETQSDKDGKFAFETTINEITPVDIVVGLDHVDMIVCPNGNYDIEIEVNDRAEDKSFFEKEPPEMYINTIDDGGFYAQYLAVAEIVDYFLYDNAYDIIQKRNLKLLDELDNQINTSVGEIKYKFISDFVKYRKASVIMAVNQQKVLKEYFDNQEVLYSQYAYMDVFQEVFKTVTPDADFLSRNKQLAELINLNNVRKCFFSNACDKKYALKTVNDIKKSSKYVKNQEVADHIIAQINDLTYDSEAPDFNLKNNLGKVVQLSDYQDDMVLLQFVDRYSPLNEHEFSVLNELQKQWNDTIQVVTIATKETFDDYVQLFEKQGYKWQLLNLDFNILLLEKYHIVMFPSYVILKKNGRVGMAPAPAPDHNLENHVRRISRY
ncbi:MAG: redoxin domain-containing protein [Bacteroidales bacterium]|nr:redoxin domain-containing protein [Bacteroidales bacterium]